MDNYVFQDNLRCPSGVSYMLENRELVNISQLSKARSKACIQLHTHFRDTLESLTIENLTLLY
jgi:uncharacterized circularly permuted ATP-grasp superfamily protein